MTKDFDIHKCKTLNLVREIIYINLSWNLDDGHDGYIEILYCPYCGVKLEKK